MGTFAAFTQTRLNAGPHGRQAANPADLERRGTDVLQLLVDRCHELGVKVYVSQRISQGGRADRSRAHSEWSLKTGAARGRSPNCALPEVRTFFRDFRS